MAKRSFAEREHSSNENHIIARDRYLGMRGPAARQQRAVARAENAMKFKIIPRIALRSIRLLDRENAVFSEIVANFQEARA